MTKTEILRVLFYMHIHMAANIPAVLFLNVISSTALGADLLTVINFTTPSCTQEIYIA